jgi:hydrogenase expression/formation protein HypC
MSEGPEMCLGIPGQVVELLQGYDGQLAVVDVRGAHRRINIGMLEDEPLMPGDWVLIHMGFALERVDETAAREALAGLELMGRPRDSEPPHEVPRG